MGIELKWILVAEDDPDDRFLFEEAVREAQIAEEVCFVEDGEQLFEMLGNIGNHPPSVIVLDLNMPRVDGREVLSVIGGIDIPAPMVVLTTSAAETDRRLAQASGAREYYRKPDNYSGLVALLSEIHAKFIADRVCHAV